MKTSILALMRQVSRSQGNNFPFVFLMLSVLLLCANTQTTMAFSSNTRTQARRFETPQWYPTTLEIAPRESRQILIQNSQTSLLPKVTQFVSDQPQFVKVSPDGVVSGLVANSEPQNTVTLSARLQDGSATTLQIRYLGPGAYAYFEAPISWKSIYVYAWKLPTESEGGLNPPIEIFGPWPGKAMEASMEWGGSWQRFFVKDAFFSALGSTAGLEQIRLIFNNGQNEKSNEFVLPRPLAAAKYFTISSETGAPERMSDAKRGTQIQIAGGRIFITGNENMSGLLFHAGQLLNVEARAPAPGEKFSHFEGTGSRYLLNPRSPTTKLVVGNEASLTLFAVFESVLDPFERTRTTYLQQCSGCHGLAGNGNPPLTNLADRYTKEQLANVISSRMPPQNPGVCKGDCSESMAALLFERAFSKPPNTCSAEDPASYPIKERGLRLLTRKEYANAVKDLLLLQANFEANDLLPEDFAVDGFRTDSSASIPDQALEGYVLAAERAASSVASWQQLEPQCNNESCFVEAFGLRVFRRPLAPSEKELFAELLSRTGVQGLVSYALAAPQFLYRSELGQSTDSASGRKFKLTDYEVATWLSFSFLGTTPPIDLLQRAAESKLRSAEQVAEAARRLLQNEQARKHFRTFTEGWLDLEATVASDVSTELKQEFVEEDLRFVDHVIFDEKGGLAELLLAPYSMISEGLAKHYGLNWAPPTNETTKPLWLKTLLSAKRPDSPDSPSYADRKGILGHAQFFASHATTTTSHPIKRGLFIRKKLLCQEFPPPPVGAELKPVADLSATTRQRFEILHARPDCAACHRFIDGVGFGLENYSQSGTWRAQEQVPSGAWKNIDASGSIGSLFSPETVLSDEEEDVAFSGITALAGLILESPNSRACFARQVFRYFEGRREEASDTCTIRSFSEAFRNEEGGLPPSNNGDHNDSSVLQLLLQFTQTPQFFYRK